MNKLLLSLLVLFASSPAFASPEVERESSSRLSDEKKDPEPVPFRPSPLFEVGDPFLDTGELSEGIRMPGGAVWRPRLMVFGDARASMAAWQRNGVDNSEFIFDARLYTNLYLTSTERILFNINPFSRDGLYSGRRFAPIDDSFEQFNAEVDSLFFEGELGELFPSWDINEDDALDIGFSVGRQILGPEFNDGFLVNDRLDMLGVTRNTILGGWFSNLRLTAIGAWGDINRGHHRHLDEDALLFGLLTSSDLAFRNGGKSFHTTVDLDLIYVSAPEDTGDGLYFAVSAAQRIATGLGALNTTFRFAASQALEDEGDAVTDGQVFFFESSLTPHGSKNLLYLNGYWGVGEFTSAARDPRFTGVLAQVGISFAEVGLGAVPPALSSNPANSLGFAMGWQIYSSDKDYNLVLELAGQAPSQEIQDGALAFASRFQKALHAHLHFQLEASWTLPAHERDRYALRAEFLVKF